jgi:hypothetical protein
LYREREATSVYAGITELTSPAQPQFERAAAFARHCFALMNECGLVPAARLELRDIARLAPYLTILGVIDDGKDFAIRLTGTRLAAEFLGGDPTGRRLSQILTDDAFGQRSWHIIRAAYTAKRPMLNQPGRTRFKDKSYLSLETITLPLTDDAGHVVKIASLYDFKVEQG